jgi:hypothetical protein
MSFSTPILFLIFNRPETTLAALEGIKKIKPRYLYVAADGPRDGRAGEAERCAEARHIIETGIDWACEVKTLFRSENLGCGKAVSNAIDWFFEQVESGIILEDDCIADPTFFNFCAELLERYRDQPEIMHIGGVTFQSGNRIKKYSYYFSNYVHVWGWATWRRAWRHYTFDIPETFYDVLEQKLARRFVHKDERTYWRKAFDMMSRHEIDTWDMQWSYSIYRSSGIGITPATNLVSNIGFDADATHTGHFDPKVAHLPLRGLTTIRHPEKIRIDERADRYTYKNLFQQGDTRFNRIKFKIGQKLPVVKQVYLKLLKRTPRPQ